jgi:hypothetical protein
MYKLVLGDRSEPLATAFCLGALLALAVLVCLMLLALEWRAVFRYSASASATVASVLMVPAALALLALLATVAQNRRNAMASPAVWQIAAIAASLGFACFTHLRWATRIANWLTRTA